MMKRFVLLVLFVLVVGAGCGGNEADPNSGKADAPARAVEKYLSAKVSGNAGGIRAGLCADMESVLERELRTFESVSNATLENMSCVSDDAAATAETVVRCTGEIAALYGTEETTFPLAAYRAVNEDGEWKWCGETQ